MSTSCTPVLPDATEGHQQSCSWKNLPASEISRARQCLNLRTQSPRSPEHPCIFLRKNSQPPILTPVSRTLNSTLYLEVLRVVNAHSSMYPRTRDKEKKVTRQKKPIGTHLMVSLMSEEESGSESESGSDSEVEKHTHATWKAYYEKGKAKHFLEKLLMLFFTHLQNILGGCKKQQNSIEYAQKVRKICENLKQQPQDASLTALLAHGGLNVWKMWARPLLGAKKARPGTIKSSISSLVKFFEFVVDYKEHKVSRKPEIDSQIIEKIKGIIPRLVAMASSVSQLYAHEKWEQVLEEQADQINPEDTSRMAETEPAKKAVTLLQKSSVRSLSEREYVIIRDFLLARITLENGQRPGPLETARVHDCERMEAKDT